MTSNQLNMLKFAAHSHDSRRGDLARPGAGPAIFAQAAQRFRSPETKSRFPRAFRLRRWLGGAAVILCLGAWLASRPLGPEQMESSSVSPGVPSETVTIPFVTDHYRMIVEVGFPKRDGTVRRAAAWVDTGNASLALTAGLARELGLPKSGEAKPVIPTVLLGQRSLDTSAVPVKIRPGQWIMPGVPAEVQLPPSVFRGLHVVMDYPAKQLTVASPGTRTPRGKPVPCVIHPETGLLQILADVGGEPVSLAVDNGSAGTWISNRLAGAWRSRHPDWPQATGAAGSANFFGFPFEAAGGLLRLPRMDIGPVAFTRVQVLGLDQELFDWYSQKTVRPVDGFIGANVLRNVRLEIDFHRGMTWWNPGPSTDCAEPPMVGLTLRPEADGTWTVAGVVRQGEQPVLSGIEPGDRLVAVSGLETARATMGAVVEALRGRAGETRRLALERAGKRLQVDAPVTVLPR